MSPRIGLFVALLLVAPLGLPAALAGPVPDSPPLPGHLPVPVPVTPQDEGITIDVLQELVKEILPGSVLMDRNCVMGEEAPYGKDEDPGEPVTYEVDEDNVVVRIWHEGTVYTFKVKQECISYKP